MGAIHHQDSQTSFVYRVIAVIVDGERVLLHRSEQDRFWSLPGGQVEMMEDSPEALVREMREELGCEVELERLLWMAECFYPTQGGQTHEIGLYYLARLLPGERFFSGDDEFSGLEVFSDASPDGLKLTFRWFPRNPAALAAAGLLPVFLRQGLAELPETITHIVDDGRPLHEKRQ